MKCFLRACDLWAKTKSKRLVSVRCDRESSYCPSEKEVPKLVVTSSKAREMLKGLNQKDVIVSLRCELNI